MSTQLKTQSKHKKFKTLWHNFMMNKTVYLLLIPVLVVYIIYSYVPMGGIILAWKEYYRKLGIYGSPWVGWENFRYLFSIPQLSNAIRNTLVISTLNIIFCFPIPILFALFLNEVTHKTFKRSVQTMTYLPHFISWVIVGGLAKMILAYDDGAVNNIIALFGGKRIPFMTQPNWFYPILMVLIIWKETGWSAIIYIAALTGIDPTLYEAAKIDGCKRSGLIWRITIPCILPTIATMFVMKIAGIMNAGFDSIYNLYNDTIYEVADTIDTFAYRLFVNDSAMELNAAVSLFKTSINVVFLVAGNIITKKMTGYSMYSFDN